MRPERGGLKNSFWSPAQLDLAYAKLLKMAACGPYDGGCLAFAMALQKIYGGDIWVIEGRQAPDSYNAPRAGGPRRPESPIMAQHAALRLPHGIFLDASGPASEERLLKRAPADFGYMATAESVRAYRDGDLVDAPCGEDLVAALVDALAGAAAPDPGVRAGEMAPL